jgi:Holliday junction resolvasome RuvABC endonuclease subunit
MRILAIDPGNMQSAYVLFDLETSQISGKGIVLNHDLFPVIEHEDHDVMAIEMIASYGMPVGKEVFETCVWIGRFWQTSERPVRLVYRREVKMHLCGNMRAKDANIRAALIDLLGKESTKGVSKDMWAALGVAVTFARHQAETSAK